MGKVIPIAQQNVVASGCSTGPTSVSGSSCASAGSCSSASSCSSAGGGDSDDVSAKLAREGWILRTTIGEPRLSEVVSNYRAMGFEVHVEQYGTSSADSKDGEAACTSCYDAADKSDASQVWGSVYVRPGGKPSGERDELF
jgi:hypothetical protein